MPQETISDSTSSELGSYPQAWEAAKTLVAELGKIPVTFTTPVRTLMYDHKNDQILSPAGHFLTTRLLRSPTLKAMFYYASLTFFGDRIANSAYLSSSDLVRLYKPKDCAGVLATIYLVRRLLSKGVQNLPDWEDTLQNITKRSEAGGHIGLAIPSLGQATGIITGSFRNLAIALFGINNPDKYNEYRSYLNSANLPYHLDYELQNWECTHLDIVGNLLQQFGFGISQAHAYILGLGRRPPKSPNEDLEGYQYALTSEWIECLILSGKEPDRKHLGQYYPTEKDKYRLLYEINSLNETNSKHNWLSKSKGDINPHATPQLYQEFLMELEQSAALESFYQENLPADVLDDLSPDDIKELSKFEKDKM